MQDQLYQVFSQELDQTLFEAIPIHSTLRVVWLDVWRWIFSVGVGWSFIGRVSIFGGRRFDDRWRFVRTRGEREKMSKTTIIREVAKPNIFAVS